MVKARAEASCGDGRAGTGRVTAEGGGKIRGCGLASEMRRSR